MTRHTLKFGFAALLCASTVAFAQAPAGAPNGATGQCKDGTYTTAAKKSGACSGHQGVKTWYASSGSTANSDTTGSSSRSQSSEAKKTAKSDEVVNPHSDATMSSARANAINKKSGNAVVATPNDNGKTMPGAAVNGAAAANGTANENANGSSSRNSARGSYAGSVAGRTAAPGGGPGMVWLNTTSNVYHCYGSEYYGKTKNGKYVSEKDAMNMGARADHGKSCSAK
jgi:hypothetical protein